MTTSFNVLDTNLNAHPARKASVLEIMNNLVANFDKSMRNATAQAHIDGSWAVAIIEDGGDDNGADWYRKLHQRLMNELNKEHLAFI